MGTEGPEALVAMGETEVTCQHHLHMAPDGRTGVDPGSLGWRQTKERTGSEWPIMAYWTLNSNIIGMISNVAFQSELKLAQRLKLRAFLRSPQPSHNTLYFSFFLLHTH